MDKQLIFFSILAILFLSKGVVSRNPIMLTSGIVLALLPVYEYLFNIERRNYKKKFRPRNQFYNNFRKRRFIAGRFAADRCDDYSNSILVDSSLNSVAIFESYNFRPGRRYSERLWYCSRSYYFFFCLFWWKFFIIYYYHLHLSDSERHS